MRKKTPTHASDKISATLRKPLSRRSSSRQQEQVNSGDALARAQALPASELTASDIFELQRTAGNRAVHSMLEAMLSRPESSSPARANQRVDYTGDPSAQASERIAPHVVDQPPVLQPRHSTAMNVIQRQSLDEDLQESPEPIQRKEIRTGLPDNLKAGIENLSGIATDDVKVHYNSAKPASMQAFAFTQGTDIYLGPNEEEHLPHEAWHVAQQKRGRVKPTLQFKGMPINDDQGLERCDGETSARFDPG